MTRRFFSSEDLEKISRAVKEAEKRTAGEIVPYFVERSDTYDVAAWRGGALFASIAVVAIALLHLLTETWHGLGPLEIGIIILGALGLGVFITHRVAPLKRLLAGNDLLELRVAQRAAQAFIAEEVFKTRDRTGILLFLSLLEHKVLVVGDSGISARVEQSEWRDVVETITRGIQTGKPADGLIEAIRKCGILLQKKGVRRHRADRNELGNKLRIGKTQRRKP
ncbi:MAG: hypothetical protein HBSIN02_19300 [Bacteroidia bacterium]|nr:MAG: hypothetical protein HBSIN02_19300 [Bacteroidia bacterium]